MDDAPGVAACLQGLRRKGARDAVLRVARGLHAAAELRFADACPDLAEAQPFLGQRGLRAQVKAAFLAGRYAEARRAAQALRQPQRRKWNLLIDGPFRRALPHAAGALAAPSPDGHYRVITDLGLKPGAALALERRLEQATPSEREALVDQARARHRTLRTLGETLDKAHRAYRRLLRDETPPQVQPTVYVFQRAAEFKHFTELLGVRETEHAQGTYLPHPRVLVLHDRSGPRGPSGLTRDTLQILLHEAFHQWLHLHVRTAPRWFDEGLAEYFAIGELRPSGLRYGLVPKGDASRLETLRAAMQGRGTRARPFPLPELLRASPRRFQRGHKQSLVNYAQSWSFVHFLGASAGGQRLLREYFHALQAGCDRLAAYQRVFRPLAMEALEAQWLAYVNRLR